MSHSSQPYTADDISSSSAAKNGSGSSSRPSLPPRSSKSWMTRSLGTLMQLPKSTPLRALRWTTPEGPMPIIVQLPSRDKGRTIDVYVWVPPPISNTASQETVPHKNDRQSERPEPPPQIKPSFVDTLRPCLVDFHGGGFVMGGPIEQAPWCAALARSGIIAVSVAYRLGPTWEFPAALHDAEDVVRAVLNSGEEEVSANVLRQRIDEEAGGKGRITIDTTKVALSGFSSGGNVALNMLLDLPSSVMKASDSADERDWPSPFPPSHSSPLPALLFFPSLDARQATYERHRPAGMAPVGGVSKFIGRTMKNAYLPADKTGHLRASPGLAPASTIHSSTRALLILPEIDTLAEQSETWVRKLEEDEVAVQTEDETGKHIGVMLHSDRRAVRVHRIKGMGHGFTTFPDAMLDVDSRRCKAVVMEQARRWVIAMLGGDAGSEKESAERAEALAEEKSSRQAVTQAGAVLATAAE
ncbi:hypothetical protein CBS101457_000028 [Exobasidium rhododendri]|nr:hypothetical protein CBS101457_000028 [Exobasidium rhododendri]